MHAVNNMVEALLLNGKSDDCCSMKSYVEAISDVVFNYKFD